MKTFLKTLSIFVLIALVISGCTRDEPTVGEPRLFIPENQRSFTVEYGVAATLTIDVESNRQWIITPSVSVNVMGEDWAFVTPESLQGENNGQITVTLLSNPGIQPRDLNLTIATAGRISQKITIIQHGTEGPPLPTTLIYAEDFGTVATASPWPLIAAFTGWNTTGSSAATINYSAIGNVDIRSNAPFTAGSGGNNVFFPTSGGASFMVNGIVPGDYQNFFLSFGANNTNDTLSVSFSVDNGVTWTDIPFNKTATGWSLVETAFSIPAVVDSFSLRFTAGPTQFGTRIDDIELQGTTQVISPPPPPPTHLTVTPTSLNFSRGSDTIKININSNVNWTIVSSESWATVSQESGSNNATVEISVTENTTGASRSATLTISGEGVADRIVTVTQTAQEEPTLIFAETFGSPSGNPLVANFTGWVTTGVGAENVTYSGTGSVDMRTTAASPNPPFSGSGNVFFPTSSANERSFTISGINPGLHTDFELSFGLQINDNTSLIVEHSIDGTTWHRIYDYTVVMIQPGQASPFIPFWGLVTEEFSVAETTTNLRLRFTVPAGTAGNFRIDDVRLMGN